MKKRKNIREQSSRIFLKKNSKAQMNLSFGVIFSIILIIIFIAFAIFGIMKFISVKQFAQVEQFKRDLQTDIDTQRGEYGSSEVEYSLPKKISKVCFTEDEFENIYFVPEDFKGGLLQHVDFLKTIPKNSKELCINTNEGYINLFIKKNIGEILITLTK